MRTPLHSPRVTVLLPVCAACLPACLPAGLIELDPLEPVIIVNFVTQTFDPAHLGEDGKPIIIESVADAKRSGVAGPCERPARGAHSRADRAAAPVDQRCVARHIRQSRSHSNVMYAARHTSASVLYAVVPSLSSARLVSSRMRLPSFRVNSTISKFAAVIQRQSPLIHVSKIAHLIVLLEQLRARMLLAAHAQ
jgi:hypothetical protein